MTPFVSKNEHTYNSGNEIQTEDKNSIGIMYGRNIEVLSSEGVSNQDSFRPDSNRRRRRRNLLKADELLKDFSVEKESVSSYIESQNKVTLYCKWATLTILALAFAFALCIDAFFLHSLTEEGQVFVVIAASAALAADTVL